MINQVQIFDYENKKIRTIEMNGEIWWVLKDVCSVLGLKNPTIVASRLEDDEVTKLDLGSLSGVSNIVNESGLYSVILRSDKPEAKTFRRWITHKVIPSIRRNGAYITEETLRQMREDKDFSAALIERLMEEKAKNSALTDRIEKDVPKVRYFDNILQAANPIPVTLIAKDYGMSARAFNLLLNRLGVLFKMCGTWVLRQPYAGKGYAVTRTYFVSEDTVSVTTYWTQKGRHFLYEFLSECGILPVCERMEVI